MDKMQNRHFINNKKMNKIALLLIATNKYDIFIQSFIDSCDKFFLSSQNNMVEYFLFTDSKKEYRSKRIINRIETPHKKWPFVTLLRYHNFLKIKSSLSLFDYLFYSDIDMRFVDYVDEEILSDLVATRHPGTLVLGDKMTPESNPFSTAFISSEDNYVYCAGGFNGGTSVKYFNMCENIAHNIDIDLQNNIIAKWHDESHLNKYFLKNPPSKILSPSYCFPEGWNIPFKPKLLALNKNHQDIRS